MTLTETQKLMKQLVEAIDLLRTSSYAVVSILDALLSDIPLEKPALVASEPVIVKRAKPRTGLRKVIRQLMEETPDQYWTCPMIVTELKKRGFVLSSEFPYNLVRNTMTAMKDLTREVTRDESNKPSVQYRLNTNSREH